MKIIRARFAGNNSLGYIKGQEYTLIFKELGFIESFFKKHRIEIWRAEHIQDGGSFTGYCPYTSMTTFLINWEVYPTFELRITPVELQNSNNFDRRFN